MLDVEISMSSFNYIYFFLKLVWVWYQHLNHVFTSNHKDSLEQIEGFVFTSTFILERNLTFLLDTWSLHACNISISDAVVNSEFLIQGLLFWLVASLKYTFPSCKYLLILLHILLIRLIKIDSNNIILEME